MKKRFLLIIILIVLVLILAAAGFFYWKIQRISQSFIDSAQKANSQNTPLWD